jgi:hypothetical protein
MRWLSSLAALLVVFLAGTGVAVAEAPPPAQPPPLAAAVESCATSALPAARVVSFVGSMPTITGAEILRMRFELERLRPRDGQWRRMRGVAGFGSWEATQPGSAGFVFHKRVEALLVPASYRAVVRFRWEDADGKVVRGAQRRTAACAQPDLRPNLVPGPLTGVLDARPGLAIYTLLVRNTGRTAAAPFSVRVGGATVDVAALAPQQQRTVLVVSAMCLAGTTTVAVVDALGEIDESRERGNAVARRCPLWGA